MEAHLTYEAIKDKCLALFGTFESLSYLQVARVVGYEPTTLKKFRSQKLLIPSHYVGKYPKFNARRIYSLLEKKS